MHYMPRITRATCPPGPLTTSSLSLWIYCNSHSPPAPPSREPREPVASGIGKWENKRKFIPDYCGQECAFTALRQAGKRLASCLHLTAEGVCISESITLKETANCQRQGSQLLRSLNNHSLGFSLPSCFS